MVTEKVTQNEHRLWVIFHQTYDVLTRCEESVIGRAGITRQQYEVLWMMQFMTEVVQRPIIIADLAPSLLRNHNSISSIIDRMERKGLVKKVRDMDDHRAVRLEITRQGDKVFADGSKSGAAFVKKLFSIFSDEELKTLLILLKKLKTKITTEYGQGEFKIDPEVNHLEKLSSFLNREIT